MNNKLNLTGIDLEGEDDVEIIQTSIRGNDVKSIIKIGNEYYRLQAKADISIEIDREWYCAKDRFGNNIKSFFKPAALNIGGNMILNDKGEVCTIKNITADFYENLDWLLNQDNKEEEETK